MGKAILWVLPLFMLGILAWQNIPICPSRVLFGVFCPGCGLTRGTLSLMQGDWANMWRFHPLAPIMGPLLGWVFFHGFLVSIGQIAPGGKSDLTRSLPRQFWLVLGVLFISVWLARLMGAMGGLPNPAFEPEQSLLFGATWPDS